MEERYNVYQDEPWIVLKEGLIYVLRQWRKIVVFMIVGAFLFTAIDGGVITSRFMDDKYIADAQAANAAAKASYRAKKEFQTKQIANLEARIAAEEEYQSKSIMMNLNPYDLYIATRQYFVTTDYQINPNTSFQDTDYTASVLSAYKNVNKTDDLYHYVKNKAGVKGLTSRGYGELVLITSDPETSFLTVAVYGESREMVDSLMKYTCRGILRHKDEFTASIAPHEIVKTKDVTERTYSEMVAKNQHKMRKDLAKVAKRLHKLQKEKVKVKLKGPRIIPASTPSVLRSLIKYCILGIFVGLILGLLWFFVWFFLKGFIGGSRRLQFQYGLRALGQYEKPLKKTVIVDRIVDYLEGVEENDRNKETAFKYAAGNMRNYLGEKEETVLLVGTAPSDQMEEVKEQLSESMETPKVAVCGDITRDPDALKKISDEGPVVLIVEKFATQKTELEKELTILRNLEKEITGAIMV